VLVQGPAGPSLYEHERLSLLTEPSNNLLFGVRVDCATQIQTQAPGGGGDGGSEDGVWEWVMMDEVLLHYFTTRIGVTDPTLPYPTLPYPTLTVSHCPSRWSSARPPTTGRSVRVGEITYLA
jgi:hypothetical protein